MKKKILIVSLLVCMIRAVYYITQLIIMRFLDLDKIQRIPQATVILDRSGNELFRFFEEDRRRTAYEKIAPSMVNAIIATEDQRFWTNDGTDVSSLFRALINNFSALRSDDVQLQGGSTITQQIIKNIFLTKKKTIKRKLQELILAKQLTKKRQESYIDAGFDKIVSFRKAKESLVTAYLNYVYYGNHAYGIDAAARHYFRTTTNELTLLQSAILAGLPQAPSLYNPVKNPERLLGYRNVPLSGVSLDFESMPDNEGLDIFTGAVDNGLAQEEMLPTTSKLLSNESGAVLLLESLSQKIFKTTKLNCLFDLQKRASGTTGVYGGREYVIGRKDRVLCRMYEMDMIDEIQMINAFLEGRNIMFHQAKFSIRYPHFIFYVKDFFLQLPEFKERALTEEQFMQGGYTVRSTIDPKKQLFAQEANENYMTMLRKLGGSNRAFLHVDSSNGDVLSYIGSVDYNDIAFHGQVDVIRALRQIGSTIKPFFYAYLFMHYPFSLDGNIVDGPLAGDGPNNYDKKFRGKITLADALAGSRNLPVVRMFLALGKEEVFVPFLQSLGFSNLSITKNYGYPLALGAVEASLLDLAQAYIQLSVPGNRYPKINPITRVIDPLGNIVYSKSRTNNMLKKVVPDTVADMLRRILSQDYYMPSDWKWLHKLHLKNIALKTGTTDKKKNGKIFPRDGLSVVYTAHDVIVSRAGNSDGRAMGLKAYGGEINHYVLRQYLEQLQTKQMILDQPRIAETQYRIDGSYEGTDHHEELTVEQKRLLWKF